jgi:hypothetical protein
MPSSVSPEGLPTPSRRRRLDFLVDRVGIACPRPACLEATVAMHLGGTMRNSSERFGHRNRQSRTPQLLILMPPDNWSSGSQRSHQPFILPRMLRPRGRVEVKMDATMGASGAKTALRPMITQGPLGKVKRHLVGVGSVWGPLRIHSWRAIRPYPHSRSKPRDDLVVLVRCCLEGRAPAGCGLRGCCKQGSGRSSRILVHCRQATEKARQNTQKPQGRITATKYIVAEE